MGGNSNLDTEDSDQIVKLLGHFGKWQLILIVPIAFFGIMSSWEVLVTSFLSPKVDFWCSVEGSADLFYNVSEWRAVASPLLEDGKVDKCNVYDVDYSAFETVADVVDAINDAGKRTRPCQNWTYDTSRYPRTIVTDFDLVCHRDWYVTLTQSMFMAGFMLGVFSSGLISDRFGRQRTFFLTSIVLSVFAFSTGYASSIEVYIFLRFVVAATNATVFLIGYVYCMEMVGGKWKTYVGVGLEFPWALGYSVLPGIAYILPSWNELKIALACPIFFSVVTFYFLPESPRWLLLHGRVDEARAVLEKAVARNGKTWPEGFELKKIEAEKSEDETRSSARATAFDLFKTPNMLKKTLVQMYVWFTASFVYYGLTLNGDILIPGDLYVNFAVGGLLEFPAYILTTVLLMFVGRRYPQAATYVIGGLALLFTLVAPTEDGKSVLSQIGKFGVTCAFAIIYVYAAELFPTVLRTTGMGMCSVMARVGSILAPIVGRELGRQNQEAAIVIFGATSILAGILTLVLPETQGKKLPDTLFEGEEFGKEEKLFGFCRIKGRRKTFAPKQAEAGANGINCDNAAYAEEK